MSDIGLFVINNCFDLVIENSDLKIDNGLETAVAISLLTDGRVKKEDLPHLEKDQKGWWGDMYPDIDLDKIGSRLWLIDRSKVTDETLRRSEELCEEALQWMIEDGLADEIIVESEYNENKHLIINIQITRPDEEDERYSVLWDEQILRRT